MLRLVEGHASELRTCLRRMNHRVRRDFDLEGPPSVTPRAELRRKGSGTDIAARSRASCLVDHEEVKSESLNVPSVAGPFQITPPMNAAQRRQSGRPCQRYRTLQQRMVRVFGLQVERESQTFVDLLQQRRRQCSYALGEHVAMHGEDL